MQNAARGGAPTGNRNALKHGAYIAKELAMGKKRTEVYRQMRETPGEFE